MHASMLLMPGSGHTSENPWHPRSSPSPEADPCSGRHGYEKTVSVWLPEDTVLLHGSLQEWFRTAQSRWDFLRLWTVFNQKHKCWTVQAETWHPKTASTFWSLNSVPEWTVSSESDKWARLDYGCGDWICIWEATALLSGIFCCIPVVSACLQSTGSHLLGKRERSIYDFGKLFLPHILSKEWRVNPISFLFK